MIDASVNPSAEPIGRRERNKVRVKNRLYDAALKLFTEKGYEQTSVDEIAEEADVARRTFFNYFQRKEDLIDTWGERRRSRLRDQLEAAAQHGPDSVLLSLERCMQALAHINETERDVTQVMLTAWVKAGRPMEEEPFAARIFSDILETAKGRGEIAPGVDTRQAGCLLRDGYLGTLYRWSRQNDRSLDLREELNVLCGMVLHGIAASRN
ncbi:TetR/AcrR family transcriptional regulator [Streptomyces sp. NPDC047000]|uniref:TetR/AcrR family transcriptional regulator n=1 Tax=Streptomyces sp. NPDC047000 TaxID=3155474 RepID=UPI0033F5D414